MRNNKNIVNLLLLVGILICLIQVWLPEYYLTGDGPCHVANAQAMLDMWTNNSSFYSRFYVFNHHPDPNWFTHLLLSSIIYISGSGTAEKLFLTILILLHAGSMYLLMHKLTRRISLWPLVIIVFIFHQPLVRGFYNFSFSIPFFFLLIYSWINHLELKKTKHLASFFVFLMLTYFTHPVAFVFGCVTCFALLSSYALSGALNGGIKSITKAFTGLLLCVSPFAFLFLKFSSNNGGLSAINLSFDTGKLDLLFRLKFLVNYSEKELLFVSIVGIVMSATTLTAIVFRFRKATGIDKYDGFLAAAIFGMILFLFLPDWLLGGGLFVMRAGLFTMLLFCCCIAYMPLPAMIRDTSAAIIYTCFLVLFMIRMPIVNAASRGVADVMTTWKYVKAGSVLLPLNFETLGKDEDKKIISEKNNIFCHVGQHLGIGKTALVLDNYEANTSYFPLKWRPELNPYTHLSREQGIEGVPPYAAINEYEQKTGVNIDYLLMWCYDTSSQTDPHYRKLALEIDSTYHVIYTSPTRRTILWQRN